jgi:hypothetical protein
MMPNVTMTRDDYQSMVSLALYALEHGFDVEYVGCGDLLVKHIPKQNRA